MLRAVASVQVAGRSRAAVLASTALVAAQVACGGGNAPPASPEGPAPSDTVEETIYGGPPPPDEPEPEARDGGADLTPQPLYGAAPPEEVRRKAEGEPKEPEPPKAQPKGKNR